MAGIINKTISEIYKDLFYIDNSNNGFTTALKPIRDGAGNTSALALSTRNLRIDPSADTTSTFLVRDTDGNALLTVDSTNDLVKAGINQQYATTLYTTFNSKVINVDGSSHYAIARTRNPSAEVTMGTGTDPDTSYTISSTADDFVGCMWYCDTACVLDSVSVWVGANGSGNDTLRFHLCSFDIDNGNGSTSGDLTSGSVIAYGSDISAIGYEQAYYQSLTISSSSISAGKAVFLLLKSDSSNADYSVNCQIKYHL